MREHRKRVVLIAALIAAICGAACATRRVPAAPTKTGAGVKKELLASKALDNLQREVLAGLRANPAFPYEFQDRYTVRFTRDAFADALVETCARLSPSDRAAALEILGSKPLSKTDATPFTPAVRAILDRALAWTAELKDAILEEMILEGEAKALAKRMRGDAQQHKSDLLLLLAAESAVRSRYGTYVTDLDALHFHDDWDPSSTRDGWEIGFCNRFPATLPDFGKREFERPSDPLEPGELDEPPPFDPARSTTVSTYVGKKDRASAPRISDPCKALETLGLASRFAASKSSFVAFAIANLDQDPELEVWSIDERGKLERERSDSSDPATGAEPR